MQPKCWQLIFYMSKAVVTIAHVHTHTYKCQASHRAWSIRKSIAHKERSSRDYVIGISHHTTHTRLADLESMSFTTNLM